MVNDDEVAALLVKFDDRVRESAAFEKLSDTEADVVSKALADQGEARPVLLPGFIARAVGGQRLYDSLAGGVSDFTNATRQALDGEDFDAVAHRFIDLALAEQKPEDISS